MMHERPRSCMHIVNHRDNAKKLKNDMSFIIYFKKSFHVCGHFIMFQGRHLSLVSKFICAKKRKKARGCGYYIYVLDR